MNEDRTALAELLSLLDVERGEGDDVFHGPVAVQAYLERQAYGGQLIAQALAAAARTVPAERAVSSLHAHFVRPGDSGYPVTYHVDRLSDGRSFSNRHISATQHRKVIITLSVSFHQPETGLSHQDQMPPDVPDPESLPTYAERLAKAFHSPVHPLRQPFDMRFVGPISFDAVNDPSLRDNKIQVWLRADGILARDRDAAHPDTEPGRFDLLDTLLLAYISDVTMLDTIALRHGLSWERDRIQVASLDHSMWFHRPFRADEWLLVTQSAPVAFGARGMVMSHIYTRDAHLVASQVQQGLIRVPASRQ